MSTLAMRTEPGNMQAGILALLVHLAFFALLVFGLSWQKQEPEAVVVDLWSKLPAPSRPAPPPAPPAPAIKPEPVKAQPKVEPKAPPKVEPAKPDIALKPTKEDKKRPEPKPVETVKKPEAERKPPPVTPDRDDIMKKIAEMQSRQAANDIAAAKEAQQAAAQQSVIGEYKGRIKRKIRGFLNRQLCGEGNPQLEFEIALLPTGQLRGNPILRKSSGIAACDRAVESAIFQSDPLPVPPQPEIFNEFRNLRLVFRPNDPND